MLLASRWCCGHSVSKRTRCSDCPSICVSCPSGELEGTPSGLDTHNQDRESVGPWERIIRALSRAYMTRSCTTTKVSKIDHGNTRSGVFWKHLVEEVLAHLMGEVWGEFGHPEIQVVHHHLINIGPSFNTVIYEKSDGKVVDHNHRSSAAISTVQILADIPDFDLALRTSEPVPLKEARNLVWGVSHAEWVRKLGVGGEVLFDCGFQLGCIACG